LILKRSVTGIVLLRPEDRLTRPGPSTEPTWLLPKRPIGNGTVPVPLLVVQAEPGVQAELPGQVNALALLQLKRFLPAGLMLTPATRSGCCVRWPRSKPPAAPLSPEPVPEGSPWADGKKGVPYGAVCVVRMEEAREPPPSPPKVVPLGPWSSARALAQVKLE
jgi:hypothetical protein